MIFDELGDEEEVGRSIQIRPGKVMWIPRLGEWANGGVKVSVQNL